MTAFNIDIPPDLNQLFASARKDEITPKDFLQALEEKGVTGSRAMFLCCKGI
jgi:hypothetical protein